MLCLYTFPCHLSLSLSLSSLTLVHLSVCHTCTLIMYGYHTVTSCVLYCYLTQTMESAGQSNVLIPRWSVIKPLNCGWVFFNLCPLSVNVTLLFPHTPTIVSKDTVTAKVIVPIHTSDLPHTPIFFTTCISTLCKSVRGSHYVCMCEWWV